jgi:4-amino-4-deoxy-L-arabinose transferase-like glycosyltransferase
MAMPDILYSSSLLSTRSAVSGLLVLYALGLALRLLATSLLGDGLASPLQGDEGDYLGVALRLLDGQGFVGPTGQPTAMHPPSLPLLLAGLVWLGGDGLAWLRVALAALCALIIPACFALTRTVTGSLQWAWSAALLATVFPTWLHAASVLQSDMLTALLVTTMAWCLLEGARRHSLCWLACGGLCWGAAILTRAVCLVYAPAVVVWACLLPGTWRRRLGIGGVVFLACGCLLVPWTARNYAVFGTWGLMSTQSGSELLKGNNPDATGILALDHAFFDGHVIHRHADAPHEAVRSAAYQADAVQFIRTQPWRFVQLCGLRFIQLWKLWSPRMGLVENLAVVFSLGLLLPWAFLAVWHSGWRDGPTLLLVGLVLCQTTVHMLFTANARYRLPVEPLVVVLALAGMAAAWRGLPVCPCEHYRHRMLRHALPSVRDM